MEQELMVPKNIFFNIYVPEKNSKYPKAAILLLHGMQEHSGRYLDFVRYMTKRGFAFICYDHAGHGHTAKSNAEMSFFRKKKPDALLLDNAKKMAFFMQTQFPETPLILMGHSMGSFIARLILKQAHRLFSGAIIMGTGASNPAAILFRPLLYLVNIIAPKKRSKYLNKFFSKMNNSQFRNEQPNDGTNWLSANLASRQAFLADELCGVDFSNNAFYGLINLSIKATKTNWVDSLPRQFPMLFISGTDDPIGNFGKGVEKTVNNLKKQGFTNVSIYLFSGMRHEILSEKDKQSVYNNIESWLTNLTDK